MSDEKTRARFIDAANFLAALHGEGFTLSDLYAEAKLGKSDFRRVFRTKAELLEAARQANISAAEIEHSGKSEKPRPSGEEWVDRRLRVLERAIASLETQISDVKSGLSKASAAARNTEAPSHADVTGPIEPGVPELPPIVADTGHRFEPPPLVAHSEPASAPEAASGTHADTNAASDRKFDREALASYWSVANEVPEHQSYRTAVVVVIAIVCGILAGILTSTIHAGADVSASSRKARVVADNGKASPIQDLLDRANKGDTVAETKLAIAYMQGTDVKPDLGNAIHWAEAAASRGNVDAKYLLGALLRAGAKPDLPLAARWYQEAAEGGNVKAMHNLGIALLNGSGVKKDDTSAVHWFERAANLGYRDSQFDLAVLYERGQGVPQNPSEALRWYEMAAASGDIEAAKRATWLRENVRGLAMLQ